MVPQRAALLVSLFATTLEAQAISTGRPKATGEVGKSEYLRFLPVFPSVGIASAGSREFQLYGTYADPYLAARGKRISDRPAPFHPNSLIPSVDSTRAARFHEIAVRFRPVIRRHSNSSPRSINDLLGLSYSQAGDSLICSERTILHRDGWSVAGVAPTLAHPRTIDLGIAEMRRCPRGPPIPAHAMSAADDSAYQEVLFAGVEGDLADRIQSRQEVLYFDLPGRSTEEWGRTRLRLESLPPAVYAHLYVERVSAAGMPDSLSTYDPIVQYWFYFPGNDSGNDHEGDWEHINVHITTRSRAASGDPYRWFPPKNLIDSLLNPDVPLGEDFVISAVDYYFHHYVAILDYKPVYAGTAPEPHAAGMRDSMPRDTSRSLENLLERFGHWDSGGAVPTARHVYRAIRRRMSAADRKYETHPIGFIGGSTMSVIAFGKGPALGRDQNSHGTYPFAGMWHGIGPIGAVEMTHGKDPSDDSLADEFIDFAPEEIRLLPDWEPLWELFSREGSVRQRWGWLVLPVRWGFPVFESPLMRQIERYDFGGVAPIGPVYNHAWNRFGPGPGYHLYRIRSVPAAFQRSLLDIGHPSLGFLNLPVLLFTKVPPFNAFASHLLVAPAAAGLAARNFEQQGEGLLTRRYSAGLHGSLGGMVRLHRRVADSLAIARADPGEGAGISERIISMEHGRGAYIAFEVPFARKFVATATVRFPLAWSLIRYEYPQSAGTAPLVVEGKVEPWELTGEFGRRLPTLLNRLESRVRFGYGWTWYRYRPSDAIDTAGAPRITGGRNPLSFWAPNSLSAGLTTDIGLFNPPRNLAEASLLQVGVRLGATVLHTRRSGFRGVGQIGLTATW